MELAQKQCIPCEGTVPSLSMQQAQKMLKQAPGWSLRNNVLHREYIFKDFNAAIEFVNKVAVLAESQCHHPGITIHYNKVSLELSTHAINGLSENDFILAAKINKL